MKGSAGAHATLVRAILAELGSLPGVVIGANASGRARYMSERGKVAVVPYGWLAPGGPDLLAVVAPLGRLVGLEAKTGGARLTKGQRACHEALRAVGVAVASPFTSCAPSPRRVPPWRRVRRRTRPDETREKSRDSRPPT